MDWLKASGLTHGFAHPRFLLAIPVLGLLAGMMFWSHYIRRRLTLRLGIGFGSAEPLFRFTAQRIFANLGLLVGLGLLALGAAGPQWGKDWNQSVSRGRDLMIVLDCSRSMMAESPSRMERARDALLDLARALPKQGGHRVGLVAFAGRARLLCPLTSDYDHFQSVIQGLENEPLNPELAPGGIETSGTRIGLGISEAVRAQDPRFVGRRDLFLLSDGDDPAQDGEYRRGIEEAMVESIPIYTFGIGNPDEGSPIIHEGKPVTFQGETIVSRLQEAPLREIAQQTHGFYTPVRQRVLPLGQFYLDLAAGQDQREQGDDEIPTIRQHYFGFLLAAFVLLAVSMLRRP